MKQIILATGNKHKVIEIKDILKDLPVEIKPMTDFEKYPEVIEDGQTLQDNAQKKATEVHYVICICSVLRTEQIPRGVPVPPANPPGEERSPGKGNPFPES